MIILFTQCGNELLNYFTNSPMHASMNTPLGSTSGTCVPIGPLALERPHNEEILQTMHGPIVTIDLDEFECEESRYDSEQFRIFSQ